MSPLHRIHTPFRIRTLRQRMVLQICMTTMMVAAMGVVALVRIRGLNDSYRQSQDENRSAPDPRHRGKVNVAFCDGHVETMAIEDLGYVINADGSFPAAAPGAHNRLFSGTGADLDPPSIY